MRLPLVFLPVAAALLLAGCIGAQDYADILDEARRRGGGAEPFVVRDAVEAVAAKVAADPDQLLVASIRISPRNVEHREPAGFMLGDFRALDLLPELVADAGRRAGFTQGGLGSLEISAELDRRTGVISTPKLSVPHWDARRGGARHEYDADGNLL